jgi:hypothetical protein
MRINKCSVVVIGLESDWKDEPGSCHSSTTASYFQAFRPFMGVFGCFAQYHSFLAYQYKRIFGPQVGKMKGQK